MQMNDVCYNTQGNAAMFVLYVFIRHRKRLETTTCVTTPCTAVSYTDRAQSM